MSDEADATSGAGDDDLASLPAPKRGKNPLLAAAVIALAAVIGWHLRDDVRYAFAARTPAELGDARSLAARGVALADDRYVTVGGQPERRYALYVEPKGERSRQTIFRILGARPQLFVRAGETSERGDLAERWTGRLRRFDAVPWAASLRKYYAGVEVTRYLDLSALQASLSGGTNELRDRMGEPLTLTPEQKLVVDVDYPGELKVYLSKDKFPSAADALHELDRLQLAPRPNGETKDEFEFVVPMPEARKNEIVGKLSARELVFQPREERYPTTRARLALDGATLHLGRADSDARVDVPWARVKAVGAPAPVDIGPDAYVLLEGEAPSQLWWAPLVLALLVAFAAFNVWYLVRTIRSSRTT